MLKCKIQEGTHAQEEHSWGGTRIFLDGSLRMVANGSMHPSTHSHILHILLAKTGHTAIPVQRENSLLSRARGTLKSQSQVCNTERRLFGVVFTSNHNCEDYCSFYSTIH